MSATTTEQRVPPASSGAAVKPRGSAPQKSRDVRRTLLSLLASALGVLPLNALFTDRGWLVDVWLTMAVVIAPAALLRQRRRPAAWQIWVGVLALIPWLTVNFVRPYAVLGVLPLSGAWHQVGALLTDVHHTTQDEVAPVHTTVGVRLAICALLGLVAALVDLLAVVGRRGALAGVPLLIVFTVSGAVPRHPVSWIWFAFAAVGFLILLALDSSDDLQRWGHYVPRAGRSSKRRSVRAMSGQRIAAAAIAIAIVLPLFIPADSRNFVSNLFHPGTSDQDGFGAGEGTSGSGSGGIDPFAALRGELNRNKNINLLSVQIDRNSDGVGSKGAVQPFYLRTNVLSTYTSSGWRAGAVGATESIDSTHYASSPGTSYQPTSVHYSADITVTGLHSNPAVFGSPTRVSGVADATRWSPQELLLVGPRTKTGDTIHEDVAQADPSVNDLKAATDSDAALASSLTLPTIAAYVRNLTKSVTRTATTPYEKARAISDYFADPNNDFSYSTTTVTGDSGDDLTDFLQNKVGYCQQYAAAMAVMLRLSGVPSRVVLGYAHAAPNSSGAFTVTAYDAHAWVEAYFAGIGWVPFDPTPLVGIAGGATSDLAWAPHAKAASTAPGQGLTPTSAASTVARPSPTATNAPSAVAKPAGRRSLHAPILLGILAIVIVVALVPATARWLRRRQRLRKARHGDTDALWAELCDTATDLGHVWSAARSPRQVATWLGPGGDEHLQGSLRELADTVERDRYAPPGVATAADLTPALAAVERGLRAQRSRREQLSARFWPASLGWTRAGVLGRLKSGPTGRRR